MTIVGITIRLIVSYLSPHKSVKYYSVYKVYLKPSRPSMNLPPALARLFAIQNFIFSKHAITTIIAAAIMQAIIPG